MSYSKRCMSPVLALLSVALLAGCRDDGRYQLSGAATFQGKPIPTGEVRLTPDTSQGNRGPAVLAMIKDGRYETSAERGVLGGHYVLRVTGYGAAPASNDPTAPDFGRPLFPARQLFVELPQEDFQYDIKIE